jgi:peptidoglycan-associated lipoprotein
MIRQQGKTRMKLMRGCGKHFPVAGLNIHLIYKINPMKRFKLFSLLFLLPFFMSAQTMRQADNLFASQQYFQALQTYQSAFKKCSKAEVGRNYYQQAECLRMMSDWNRAKIYYDKAIRANYTNDMAHFYLAQMHQMSGEYSEAIAEYGIYQKLIPSDPAAAAGIESCQNSLDWLNQPNRWKVQNEAQLNSKSNDFCPAYSNKKHNTLIFSSKRPGQTGSKIDPVSGGLYSDLFEAMVDAHGKWSTPAAVQGDVNLPASNDGASCITKNGNHIYYTKCGQKKKEMVTCKIYYAEKQGNKWGTPVLIDFGLPQETLDSFNFRHPAVSVNEDVMVFSSDMSGTTGGVHSDLWVSTYDKKSKTWSRPVNMGPNINTAQREGFPYIADNGDLYFSSDGHAGMGGLDIYHAPKVDGKTAQWGKPENMKSPINSPADDFGIVFDGKRQKGYLTSNRQGTKGADDIWSFYWEIWTPPLDVDVFDCENHTGIKNALVEIVGNDGSTQRIFSDANGHCEAKLKENVNYVINVFGDSAKGPNATSYFSLPEGEKGKITTLGMTENKTFKYDFCLPPVKLIDMFFPAVLYDLDSPKLRPESKDSLNYLYKLLIDNPNLVIEIDAHTDCQGSADHNRKLAQDRAEACVNYLVNEKGIAKERLVAKGWGEDKPLKLNGTVLTEKYIMSFKSKAERDKLMQLNRRTTFRILRTDYVNPKAPTRGPVSPVNIQKGYFDETGDEIPADSEVPADGEKQVPQPPAPRQD